MGVLKHVLLVCVLKHVLKHDNLDGTTSGVPKLIHEPID